MSPIDEERERARRNNRRNRLITSGLIVVTQLMGLSVHYSKAWLHWVNISTLVAGAVVFAYTLVRNRQTKRAV
jgi:hypothetical protein